MGNRVPPRAPSVPPSEWFDGPTALTPLSRGAAALRSGPDEVALARVLLVARDPEGELRMEHTGDVCRIGSHPGNDLVLRDRTVSRFHCRLVRDGAIWRVSDCGSSNGTRVDGVRVREAELGAHSRLTLGDSTVTVTALADEGHVVAHSRSFGALVGASVAMKKLYLTLERVAASDSNVLLGGESGTGKELVAGAIVSGGPRAQRPFVVVDCGTLSSNLVESDLFGHVRGAFTGADRDRIGAFETADGGTVFLDEIAELPMELQPRLLRVLESREVRRVGETRSRKVDVRVVAATHRDLEREVNRGRFREDLFFRLSVVNVTVPPLRERIGDVPLLVRSFLSELGVPELENELFSEPVLAALSDYDWPGNVRELKNHVERSVVLRDASAPRRWQSGTRPRFRSEPPAATTTKPPIDAALSFRVAKERAIDEFERTYLAAQLERAGGNVSKAARAAGMDRMHLHHLLQKYGLKG